MLDGLEQLTVHFVLFCCWYITLLVHCQDNVMCVCVCVCVCVCACVHTHTCAPSCVSMSVCLCKDMHVILRVELACICLYGA